MGAFEARRIAADAVKLPDLPRQRRSVRRRIGNGQLMRNQKEH
jgi:hypothetical protein